MIYCNIFNDVSSTNEQISEFGPPQKREIKEVNKNKRHKRKFSEELHSYESCRHEKEQDADGQADIQRLFIAVQVITAGVSNHLLQSVFLYFLKFTSTDFQHLFALYHTLFLNAS